MAQRTTAGSTPARGLAICLALGLAPVAAAEDDWEGLFLGLHAGYGATASLDLGTRAVPTAVFKDLQGAGENVRADDAYGLDGVLGGVQGGYLRQYGEAVYGLEFSWSRTDLQDTVYDDVRCPNANLCATDDRFRSELDDVITLSLRAGRSFGRQLLYVRGGLALARHDLAITDDNLNTFGRLSSGLNTGSTEGEAWLPGFSLGLGTDYRLNEHLSLGLAYDYLRFASTDVDTEGAGFCHPTTTSPLCAGQLGQSVAGAYPMELEQGELHRLQLRLDYRF